MDKPNLKVTVSWSTLAIIGLLAYSLHKNEPLVSVKKG